MKQTFFYGFTIAVLMTFIFSSCSKKNSATPNIIYIYADDMGYGDAGCYGQKYIKTPNIDKMAAEGMRFTQHYSTAPVCAPARCGILTGKHSGHGHIRNNCELSDSSVFKSGQMPLPADTETIGKMLKRRGYSTAIIGKWGLGSIASTGAPNKQGFDFFYGYADQVHAHNHFPLFLWRNDKQELLPGNVPTVHQKYPGDAVIDSMEYKKYMGREYSLDLMTDEAIRFMNKNKDRPFFLYLAFVIPHKALQVPDESIKMYEGVFEEETYDGKRGYTPHPKPLSAYAAMITRMDIKVGVILKKLKELKLDDNTIVMFSSDNGPASGGGLDPQFFNSSGGLRGMKGQLYEGGIRVPFVVQWPDKIPAGTVSNHVSTQYDLMSTLAEITGAKLNNTDGVSFLPTLLGNPGKQAQHEYLYWEFSGRGGQVAIRMGDWKGIRYDLRRDQNAPWAIYNLSKDETESNNVATQYPELIKKFRQIVKQRTPSHHDAWNFNKSTNKK